MHRPSRPAIAFILVAAVLDVMAMGIIIPVLPPLIEQFAGSTRAAGIWNGVLVALWATMQLLCSPIIGALSDQYGRRPTLLLSTAGLTVDWVLMALAPNLWWLVVGRMLGGITSASFTAIYAYMADVTPPEDRARAYGWVGSAFSLGFVAGPVVGGVLGEWGPRAPFWAAAVLSGVAFLYGWLVLPESLPAERRMPFAWSRANSFGALRLLRSHAELSGLAMTNFLLHFAHHVFSTVFVLYAAHRYGWGPFQVGMLLALVGVLEMCVQGLLVGPLVRRFGDRAVMVAGLATGAVGIAAMGAAPNGVWFTAAMFPNALWALAMPTLQAQMTRRVSEREQGQLQGANMSVASLAGIASPLFFGWIYGLSAVSLPGLSFFIASTILLCATAIGALTARRARAADTARDERT